MPLTFCAPCLADLAAGHRSDAQACLHIAVDVIMVRVIMNSSHGSFETAPFGSFETAFYDQSVTHFNSSTTLPTFLSIPPDIHRPSSTLPSSTFLLLSVCIPHHHNDASAAMSAVDHSQLSHGVAVDVVLAVHRATAELHAHVEASVAASTLWRTARFVVYRAQSRRGSAARVADSTMSIVDRMLSSVLRHAGAASPYAVHAASKRPSRAPRVSSP